MPARERRQTAGFEQPVVAVDFGGEEHPLATYVFVTFRPDVGVPTMPGQLAVGCGDEVVWRSSWQMKSTNGAPARSAR